MAQRPDMSAVIITVHFGVWVDEHDSQPSKVLVTATDTIMLRMNY